MRKLILQAFLLLVTAMGYSQVTLEQTYNYSTAQVKFEKLGYKYYLMDVPNAQCRIYNSDHSLFKTISCNVPSGCYLADIKYLSQEVFDADDGIELVYTWYKYVPTTDSYYYEYGSSIINEDGSSIAVIDGARYVYLNETGDNVWKLFAYCYDYSVWPERIWTNIYSLPGMPTLSSLHPTQRDELNLWAFPNPAERTVKVSYSLPPGIKEATLNLLDDNGKVLKQFAVDKHTDQLLLDVTSYPAGMYYYYLEYSNTRTQSGKLVLR